MLQHKFPAQKETPLGVTYPLRGTLFLIPPTLSSLGPCFAYYLRSESIDKWLAYPPPRLAVELGSCVDGEAYAWAWKPYGWFDL